MSRSFLVPLVLPADPVAAMEAATKQYCDANSGGGILVGSGPPADATGEAGDFYLDQDSNTLYGPKSAAGAVRAFDTRSPNNSVTGNPDPLVSGNQLTFAVAGQITHLWFYRAANSTQTTHTLRLWNATTKALLGTATTTAESGSAWVSAALGAPVQVAAGDSLMVSIDFVVGDAYLYRLSGAASDEANITFNGSFYSQTLGTFPDQSNGATVNMFTDVTFTTPLWGTALGNEVQISADEPTIDTVELWVDTDDPTGDGTVADTAWLTFTPTLTQGAAVAKTITSATYTRIGRSVIAEVVVAVTAAGTAGQPIKLGLPVPARAANAVVGSGSMYDASATFRYICEVGASSTSEVYLASNGTSTDLLGVSPSLALASGDSIRYNVSYEAAA